MRSLIAIDDSIPNMTAASGESLVTRHVGDSLFVGYFSSEPDRSSVLRFDGVCDWHRGYPNDEALRAHPLFGHGLVPYAFHIGPVGAFGERAWIATFHDETLTVYARSVRVLERASPLSPESALRPFTGS